MQKIKKIVRERQTFIASVIIGIATILTALSSFLGGLWGSQSTSYYNKALINLNSGNTSYLEYVQGGINDEELKSIATSIEEENSEFEKNFELAEKANSNQDNYGAISVFLSIVLFLASTSLILQKENIRFYYTLLSLFLVLALTVLLLLLPKPF